MINLKQLKNSFLHIIALFIFVSSCGAKEVKHMDPNKLNEMSLNAESSEKVLDTVTLGGGCFWCTEAQLQQLKGVISVSSGYSGGATKNPTYKEVCTGLTGHAEVIQVIYDTSVISFDDLLAAFWQSHDPTQLNRQGNDVGTQYRSVIFYHSNVQKEKAELYKKRLNEEKVYDQPIVTEIAPLTQFYKGEVYHQNYYNENGSQPYCQYVIQPKLEKFKKVFKDKIK